MELQQIKSGISLKNIFVRQRTSDEKLSEFVCLYLILNEINSILQDGFSISDNTISIVKYIFQFILLLFLFRGIVSKGTKGFIKLFIFEFVFSIPYLYSLILVSSREYIYDWWLTMVISNVPLFVSVLLIDDKKILLKKLNIASFIILILCFIDIFSSINAYEGYSVAYGMHFAYCIILVLLLHLNVFIQSKNVLFLFLVFIELIMLLVYGSRGAILCIFVYFILKILFMKNGFKKLFYLLFALLLFAFLMIYGKNLLVNFAALLENLGLSGRTISFLKNGDFITDTGRFDVWNKSWDLIMQKPVEGWGITGASEYLLELKVLYPHQIFFDFILSFGFFFGCILFLLSLYPLKLLISKDDKVRELGIIFISIVFVYLMFSGTIFTSYYYFILLGIAFNNKKKNIEIFN